MDRATAIRRLTNRWHEQTDAYPHMREQIPLALYIRANLPHVLRGYVTVTGAEPLADYNVRS